MYRRTTLTCIPDSPGGVAPKCLRSKTWQWIILRGDDNRRSRCLSNILLVVLFTTGTTVDTTYRYVSSILTKSDVLSSSKRYSECCTSNEGQTQNKRKTTCTFLNVAVLNPTTRTACEFDVQAVIEGTKRPGCRVKLAILLPRLILRAQTSSRVPSGQTHDLARSRPLGTLDSISK